MPDSLQKFIFEDFPIKGSLVRLHESWEEVVKRAQPPEFARELLGQTLCASVLLTSNIKFEGSVSLQIQSDGDIRLLLGQCTTDRAVRGVVRTAEEGAAARQPVLVINLEPEDGEQPYQGIVALDKRGLAESLQEYFNMSEQLPSHFLLVSGKRSCAGLMLQRLPGKLEDADAWNRVCHLVSTISEEEILNLDIESLLTRVFHEERVRLFEDEPVRFGCSCSEGRVRSMLKSLGEAEIQSIIEEQGQIEVCCEYCGRDYRFDRVDAADIIAGTSMRLPEEPGLQ